LLQKRDWHLQWADRIGLGFELPGADFGATGRLIELVAAPSEFLHQDFLEGNVGQQTERVLENLKAILTHAGLTLSHVAKTTVYLRHMNDFAAMNEVYAKYFPPPQRIRPCRLLGYRKTRWSRLN